MKQSTASEFLQHLRVTALECALIDVSARRGARFVANKPTFHFVLRGSCHLQADDGTFAVNLDVGDFVVIPHGRLHSLSDTPDVGAVSAQHARRIETPLANDIPVVLHFGEPGTPAFKVLSGVFQFPSQTARPLVAALPALLRRPASNDNAAAALARLAGSSATAPGGRAFVLRLADLMLLEAARDDADVVAHLAGTGPAWLRTYRIEHAIAAVTAHPAHRWTLQKLAQHVGMSRASFAAKYMTHVGQPAMQHVMTIRLRHAAELLRSTALPINEVARQSGYDSSTAFSRIFRRLSGVSPAAYRKRAWLQPLGTDPAVSAPGGPAAETTPD